MHGPDTLPWGHAALKSARDAIDRDALAAAADGPRRKPRKREFVLSRPPAESPERDALRATAEEPEPDWNALRAQAEAQAAAEEPEPDWHLLRAQAEEHMPPEPAWNTQPGSAEQERALARATEALSLCSQVEARLQAAEQAYQQAESDDEAELAAQRYEEAHAQLIQAQALYAQAQHDGPQRRDSVPGPAAFSAPGLLDAQPDVFASVFASPSIAPAGESGIGAFDADHEPPRRSKWLPKLLAAVAVLGLGVGGLALSQHQAAEAARTARTEKLLAEMRQADAAREAELSRIAAEKQAALAAEATQKAQAESLKATSVAAALAEGVEGGAKAESPVAKTSAGKARPAAKRRVAARPGKRRVGKVSKAKVSKAKKSGRGSSVSSSNDPLYGL